VKLVCALNGQNAVCGEEFIRKIQQDAATYQKFIISYLYEAQNVSGDTPPIIRSLKLQF
jgi:hypothetical protein